MVAIVPAIAKIKELRFGIATRTDDARRGLNLKAPFAPAYREQWAGQIMWAGLSRTDIAQLLGFFESLDGRTVPFGVPLAAGFASQYVGGLPQVALTLATIPALGTDKIKASATGSPAIRAGTLIALGDIDGSFQLVEAVQSSTANGTADIYIAPRIKVALADTSATAGTVVAKLALAKDELHEGLSVSPAYGTLTVDVMEYPL